MPKRIQLQHPITRDMSAEFCWGWSRFKVFAREYIPEQDREEWLDEARYAFKHNHHDTLSAMVFGVE